MMMKLTAWWLRRLVSCRGLSTSSSTTGWLAACGNGDQGRLGHGMGVGSVPKPARVLLHSALAAGEIDDDDNDVMSCSAGGAHSALVTKHGALLTAGLNDHGQLGRQRAPEEARDESTGTSTDDQCCGVMRRVALPGPAAAVSCGHYHTLVLLQSGELMAFGSNKHGQLGVSSSVDTTPRFEAATVPGMDDVVAISAGALHSIAADRAGRLYAWGCNADGRLGLGFLGRGPGADSFSRWFSSLMTDAAVPIPTRVSTLDGLVITAVAAGDMHSVVADADGKCFTFGSGRYGQLGVPAQESERPVLLEMDHPIKHVAAGGLHSAACTAFGAVFSWGANENGSLGLPRNAPGDEAFSPKQITSLPKVASVSCGWKHTAAVTTDGALYTWGWGGSVGSMRDGHDSGGGQLGHGHDFDQWEPQKVKGVLTVGVTGTEVRTRSVSCGFNHTLSVMESVDAESQQDP